MNIRMPWENLNCALRTRFDMATLPPRRLRTAATSLHAFGVGITSDIRRLCATLSDDHPAVEEVTRELEALYQLV